MVHIEGPRIELAAALHWAAIAGLRYPGITPSDAAYAPGSGAGALEGILSLLTDGLLNDGADPEASSPPTTFRPAHREGNVPGDPNVDPVAVEPPPPLRATPDEPAPRTPPFREGCGCGLAFV